jgi:hypothetical protein
MLPLIENIGAQTVCESAMFLEMGLAGIMKPYLYNCKDNLRMKKENTNT